MSWFACILMAVLFSLAAPATALQEASHTETESASVPDDMKTMIEAYVKYATPGESHAALKPMEGEWDVAAKFRIDPESPWMESSREASISWILGRRFLQQRVVSPPGDFLPIPFEGLGFLGHDNHTGKYVSVWMDTLGTTVLVGSGEKSGNGITISGNHGDPVTGKDRKYRWVYQIDNDDQFTLTMYEAPDGSQFNSAVLIYKRRQ